MQSEGPEIAAGAGSLRPADDHNQRLVEQVHPADWVNPTPAERYNMVVVGAGSAGLVTAAGAAGMGAKVALVERHLMGGDCLNYGCVPSKAVLRAARAIADVRRAGRLGVKLPDEIEIDFATVMERVRRLRADISAHDSAIRFRELGVDVFLGNGQLSGPDTLQVGEQTLRFKRACIATGARPSVPPIAGLEEAGYLTNETVFGLTSLPPRLAVIGAGPIGCELSQAFARFGAQVTLLDSAPQLLGREDPEAAGLVEAALLDDGVQLLTGATVNRVKTGGQGKTIHLTCDGEQQAVTVDEILVAVGRTPNVKGLGLDQAGVDYDERTGVTVDDMLRTSNGNIYAAGDICSPYKFTHAADAMARIVIQNALFLGRAKLSALTIPWCTYTDPELAQVGLTEQQARSRGMEVQTFTQQLVAVDRALLDDETDGMVKIVARAGSDRILGATVVARHAGEMLGELTMAISAGLGLKQIASTIHPYPTQSEAIKKLGDAYMRTRLTPTVARLSSGWLALGR
jgi:pyruvate/2-oxoglutarate dehydrogenase complex dihydrolipoamide dehydrogenase (E3) component